MPKMMTLASHCWRWSTIRMLFNNKFQCCYAAKSAATHDVKVNYIGQKLDWSDIPGNGPSSHMPDMDEERNRKHAFINSKAIGSEYGDITIFHQPSHHLINFSLAPGERQISLYCRPTNELINLTFTERFHKDMERSMEAADAQSTIPKMNSIKDVMWTDTRPNSSNLPGHYLKLSKIRLTGLVVITSMAGYILAPGVFELSTFVMCAIGTGLTSAAANSINQFFEVPYDSQMDRTKNRPIVRGLISPLHAVGFAAATTTLGTGVLCLGVNSLTAGLGLFNLILYTLVYTPMKRLSIANTWVGSIVGAVPPMMGWTASCGTLGAGAWLLACIMYAWQFPHFNALSWNLRPEYSRAGYRMMSVTDPRLCKAVTLRYSVVLVALCAMAPILNVTTWTFAVDSLPLNLYLTYLALKFYQHGDSNSSRKLFRFSLVHLPMLLVMMLISKKHNATSKTEEEHPIAQTGVQTSP